MIKKEKVDRAFKEFKQSLHPFRKASFFLSIRVFFPFFVYLLFKRTDHAGHH